MSCSKTRLPSTSLSVASKESTFFLTPLPIKPIQERRIHSSSASFSVRRYLIKHRGQCLHFSVSTCQHLFCKAEEYVLPPSSVKCVRVISVARMKLIILTHIIIQSQQTRIKLNTINTFSPPTQRTGVTYIRYNTRHNSKSLQRIPLQPSYIPRPNKSIRLTFRYP